MECLRSCSTRTSFHRMARRAWEASQCLGTDVTPHTGGRVGLAGTSRAGREGEEGPAGRSEMDQVRRGCVGRKWFLLQPVRRAGEGPRAFFQEPIPKGLLP